MNVLSINFFNIPVYIFGLLVVFSFLWGAFVFFKKSIELHYEELLVFDAIVFSAFWGFVVSRTFFTFFHLKDFVNHWSRFFLIGNFPGFDVWGLFLGIILGSYLVMKRTKAKFFDWFDVLFLGVWGGVAVFSSGLLVIKFSWSTLVLSLSSLVSMVFLWKLEDTYRTIGWYRSKKTSAKSGLISGLSLVIVGTVTLLTKIIQHNGFILEILWGIVLFVGGVLIVYIRSGRSLSDDIKIISKYGRKK